MERRHLRRGRTGCGGCVPGVSGGHLGRGHRSALQRRRGRAAPGDPRLATREPRSERRREREALGVRQVPARRERQHRPLRAAARGHGDRGHGRPSRRSRALRDAANAVPRAPSHASRGSGRSSRMRSEWPGRSSSGRPSLSGGWPSSAPRRGWWDGPPIAASPGAEARRHYGSSRPSGRAFRAADCTSPDRRSS